MEANVQTRTNGPGAVTMIDLIGQPTRDRSAP